MEEDELSSRSASPLSIKTRRRHARITRDDLANFHPATPRPAPSPASSPDSLVFPELLKFPCPPMSDLSSSPGAHSSGMPLTPSTSDSDDGFALPSPRFNPRRAAIQPLVFSRNRQRVDSDADSDSEWYHNEFSNLIATSSVFQQPLQPSRPDSVFIPSDFNFSTVKPRPASITSDTVYPRRRNSKSRSIVIPKYPPPPVPPIPHHLRSPPRPPAETAPLNFSRPPPRSSLPADCVSDLYEGDADSDSSSAFSFTMYTVDFGEREPGSTSDKHHSHTLPQSPAFSRHSLDSEFAQEIEVDLDDARFELDYQFRLPLSIPVTPFDLEADIAMSFERLREEAAVQEPPAAAAAEETRPSNEKDTRSSPSCAQDLYTPSVSSFSFSPSPSPVSFLDQTNTREERVLKSKWSSSTLGSIQEEQTRKKNEERGRSASAKLKLYFGGAGSTKHTSTSSFSSPKFALSPTSPRIFRTPLSPPPRKPKAHAPSPPPSSSVPHSPTRWPQPRAYKSKRTSTQAHHHPRSSDVLLIGYGANLKRRGSNATVSSEGGMSEVSSSSSSSSGLRRKPIPIEMFLRNAA